MSHILELSGHRAVEAVSGRRVIKWSAVFGALGVVYGDIGTSPLYAMRESLASVGVNTVNILGVTSLVFWGLVLVVAVKYCVFVLKADNHGEGGVFALMALLRQHRALATIGGFAATSLIVWTILGGGLLFADGMLTPAISVVSAVEGLNVLTPAFSNLVVPITVGILLVLFAVQFKGTAVIGRAFGPIMLAWFGAISIVGAYWLAQEPTVLRAINPFYAINFVVTIGITRTLTVLGFIMLVVTGGEALYADMGHFGARPIRISWFSITMPALLLQYFGQAAFLLGGHMSTKEVHEHSIFFSMVPKGPALMVYVMLATAATIIASQALLTGAFSLAVQAMELNLIPRLKVRYTHPHHVGQVYVPAVNWCLCVGTLSLVIAFQTSSHLASAYGLAVAGVMLATSMAMMVLGYAHLGWSKTRSIVLFGAFAVVDSTFLVANSLKFLKGGFVPLTVALMLFGAFFLWNWGRASIVNYQSENLRKPTYGEFIRNIDNASYGLLNSSVVCLIGKWPDEMDKSRIPTALNELVNVHGLPRRLVLVNLRRKPAIEEHTSTVRTLYVHRDATAQLVQLTYPLTQRAYIFNELQRLVARSELCLNGQPSDWEIRTDTEILVASREASWSVRLSVGLYELLHRNSQRAYQQMIGHTGRLRLTTTEGYAEVDKIGNPLKVL